MIRSLVLLAFAWTLALCAVEASGGEEDTWIPLEAP